MSRPTADVTWDSGGTNTLGGGTTSGHKTSGYGLDEVPTSTEMNTWMQAVALWILYLAGPDVEHTGNLTVDGNLLVDGTTHLVGNVTIDGTVSMPPVITPLPTILSTDSFTTGGGVTHARQASHWVFAASSTPIYYPILLDATRRITGYTWTLTHNSGGTTTAHLVDISPAGFETVHGSGSSGAATGSFGESGLSVDVASFTSLWIKVVPPNTITPGADDLNLVTVTSIAKP